MVACNTDDIEETVCMYYDVLVVTEWQEKINSWYLVLHLILPYSHSSGLLDWMI